MQFSRICFLNRIACASRGLTKNTFQFCWVKPRENEVHSLLVELLLNFALYAHVKLRNLPPTDALMPMSFKVKTNVEVAVVLSELWTLPSTVAQFLTYDNLKPGHVA